MVDCRFFGLATVINPGIYVSVRPCVVRNQSPSTFHTFWGGRLRHSGWPSLIFTQLFSFRRTSLRDKTATGMLARGIVSSARLSWTDPATASSIQRRKHPGQRVDPVSRGSRRSGAVVRRHNSTDADAPVAMKGEHSLSGWGDLPQHLLDHVMSQVYDSGVNRTASGCSMLKKAQFINRHWCQWANEVANVLMPSINVPAPVTIDGLKFHISQKFTNVHGLRLERDEDVSGRRLAHLKELPLLRQLDLSWCGRLTDEGTRSLAVLTGLTRLDLSFCTRVGSAGLRCLASLTKLSHLDLRWCHRVTDKGVSFLAALTNLTHLDLGRCRKVGDGGLRFLTTLVKLTHFELDGCSRVTDAGIAWLNLHTQLTHLNLGQCSRIGDESTRILGRLTNLTHLDLGWCNKISDVGLVNLVDLTNLTYLDLRLCTQIGYLGVTGLRELRNLTHLNLRWCYKIDDFCVLALTFLENLTHLDLRGCSKIGNAGANQLEFLTDLVLLDLRFCTLVSTETLRGVRALSN